jgi:hypothetical protein
LLLIVGMEDIATVTYMKVLSFELTKEYRKLTTLHLRINYKFYNTINLDMVHPVVCWNNSSKVEPVKLNTCIVLRCEEGWLHVSA